jgi:hypothetical protein
MKLMSEALQKVAGSKMRHILGALTNNRFKGVFYGHVGNYHYPIFVGNNGDGGQFCKRRTLVAHGCGGRHNGR